MRRALDRELGSRQALDGFVSTAKGRATATGPEVIGGIFSANIPALPHLTVMRSFLVKSACLGRVSRGEPLYLPLYAQSLAEIDPELSECLAVIHYDRDDDALADAFLGGIDHVIVVWRRCGAVADKNAIAVWCPRYLAWSSYGLCLDRSRGDVGLRCRRSR